VQNSGAPDARDADKKSFAGVVLAETEDAWKEEFSKVSKTYVPRKLVLFRNRVESACGRASSASGPFYCPPDSQVYLDLSFLDELSRNLGAKGDFAGAYVIAHEIGHHVQNLLGIEGEFRAKMRRMGEGERNRASVAIELQADCLAGIWAKHAENKNILETGDIAEALNAASAVGDDRLQKRSQGYVVPDSFTHGSSAQRQEAFQRGYQGGNLNACLANG
jgi:predicted metalloprotease